MKKECKACAKVKDIHGQGLCGACYVAYRRYGDPTVRKRKVKGAELCSKCGRDPVHAKGLCKHCYSERYLKELGHGECKECGEFKKIVAKGLCNKCYHNVLEKEKSAICKGCGQFKPIKSMRLCRKCYARFKRHGHTNQTRPIKGTTLCKICGKKAVHAKGMCARCYGKELRKANPDGYLDYELRKNYKITLEEYNDILDRQGGKCAICGISSNEVVNGKVTRFAVDHNHNTGEIRGLLCGNCNRGLGNLKDSPILLQKAIDYLTANGVSKPSSEP